MIKVRNYNRKNKEFNNTEGLKHLYWELFDSPDAEGSAFRYMEREPVLILDDIMVEFPMWRPAIEIGYTSQPYANLLGLTSHSPYRVGKGVRLRVLDSKKRMFLVKNLILRGVVRIAVSEKYVEFDTDNYLYKPNLYIR
tara:strand:+ start:1842 stop:2258 length:417 start_codon:yes stop_codon:yes gene_type:complete